MFNWREPLVEYSTRSLEKLLFKIQDLMSENIPICQEP